MKRRQNPLKALFRTIRICFEFGIWGLHPWWPSVCRKVVYFSPGRLNFFLMDKDQVATILADIAVLLELKGENPFKSRAYVNAARTLENLSEPLDKLVAENRL